MRWCDQGVMGVWCSHDMLLLLTSTCACDMETKATQNKENYVNVERIHLIVKTYVSIPPYDRRRCFAIFFSSNMRRLKCNNTL